MALRAGFRILIEEVFMIVLPGKTVALDQYGIGMAIFTFVADSFFLMAFNAAHHGRYLLPGKIGLLFHIGMAYLAINVFFSMGLVAVLYFPDRLHRCLCICIGMADKAAVLFFNIMAAAGMARLIIGIIIVSCPFALFNIDMTGIAFAYLVFFFM
jgi:hypothetical protein